MSRHENLTVVVELNADEQARLRALVERKKLPKAELFRQALSLLEAQPEEWWRGLKLTRVPGGFVMADAQASLILEPSLRLEAISRRAQAASPGPWTATQRFSALRSIAVLGGWSVEVPSDRDERPDFGRADAVFVAAARADVPWLLAQLLEACADASRLRKALTHAAACNDIRLRAGCGECLLIDRALGPGKLARSSHDQPGGQVASSALAPENPEERR